MRDWQREDPAASAAFRAADGDVEFQTDGTMVNSYAGWREMRLSLFAKRRRGEAVTSRDDWQQRDLPAPHVRVIQAGIRTSEQLGPAWRRMASRLGLRETKDITVIADGAKWIWRQLDKHLPGVAGVLDIYHASAQLWAAAHGHFGEDSAQACTWVEGRRATLLREGASALLEELCGAEWSGVRGYFEPHGAHTDYGGRLALGQSIGSGMVEGACKQVIGRRLKQTGARWKVRRVERMATLCAVQASGQWDAYWGKAAERTA
jgi:phosphoglycolate phosphatase-like HAD superfamily hydrolase